MTIHQLDDAARKQLVNEVATQMHFNPPQGNFGAMGTPRHPISSHISSGGYPVVPDSLRRLIAAEDKLIALADRYAEPRETYNEFLTRTAQELADGSDLPEDVLDRARACTDGLEEQRFGQNLISHLRGSLSGLWKRELATCADEMLTGLREQLAEILAEIEQPAAEVEGLDVLDPEQMAEATDVQREALAALKDLRHRYGRLRRKQQKLLESAYPNGPGGGVTWLAVYKLEIHEFSDPSLRAPQPAEGPAWYRRIVSRDDVCLPSIQELRDAYDSTLERRAVERIPDPSQEQVPASTSSPYPDSFVGGVVGGLR